uniref:Reverse transcriptase domain-containing protein n=1 Tax=Trichuris muris TaxID=70415 RepID=A0A5S6QWL8_TRIMR
MEELEELAFSTIEETYCPKIFRRNVDNIFAITENGKENVLLEHLDGLFPEHISFTMEEESNNKLPFLDILMIKEDARLKTTVYRKPTNSDRCLHFSSHQPPSVFSGIVKGMVDRALNFDNTHRAFSSADDGFKDDTVIITKADNGNVVVVMDRETYSNKKRPVII